MKDGIVIMYQEDGVIYPVALNKKQMETLDFVANLLSPLKVVKDKPQGAAINLTEEEKK